MTDYICFNGYSSVRKNNTFTKFSMAFYTFWSPTFMTAIKHAVQALSSRLSTEYSRGFDEFIRRPRHLCTVTHKAKVSQDYPGGHCMWVSV